MIRGLLTAVALGAVVLALSAGAFARSSSGTLQGAVGPGFTIKLTSGGKAVKSLKAGTYTIAVSDRSSIHNFVLEKEKGGTFERTVTAVGFMGTKTLSVKLTKGEWKFYCRPHESSMFGTFTVK